MPTPIARLTLDLERLAALRHEAELELHRWLVGRDQTIAGQLTELREGLDDLRAELASLERVLQSRTEHLA